MRALDPSPQDVSTYGLQNGDDKVSAALGGEKVQAELSRARALAVGWR
jgi:hypothetical protein